ncbi:MAG: hypothetical protein KQH53_01335 [Desulfarculaceae bacterium]|nr:hypothetical protein [Desulfarculaceae bacterium]
MKKIHLTHPQDQATLSATSRRLQWEPVRGSDGTRPLRYVLQVLATRPGPRPGRRGKPLPLFTSKELTRGYFDLPIREKGLKPGRTYWWQVKALDQSGQVAAMSEKRRFKVRKISTPVHEIGGEFRLPEGGLVTAEIGTALAAPLWATLRENMVPPAPVAWGKPVKIRLRGEASSGDSEAPPEVPGATEPLAMVWGHEAGEVYLPFFLARNACLHWDLSYIDGCQWVLLQVSGPDGFSEPNGGNVLEDAGVINYYWGPPRVSCGYDEIETSYGPPPAGTLISAQNIDLLRGVDASETIQPPSGLNPEIVRRIRTVPCDESRQPVDMASDPVTIRCVRYPVVDIGALRVEWTWGEHPGRALEFSLMFEEPFPNVLAVRLDEETGIMVPVTAPSTLLIYTPPRPSMLHESSCANLSLTMNGEPVERRNRVCLASGHPTCDCFVIPLDPWPHAAGYDFRLTQEWRGGISYNTLWDFLDPGLVAAIIPGVHPSWNYCGGVYQDYDSLYGREDLPEEGTNSPFYRYHSLTGNCLPRGMVGTWSLPIVYGISQFNDFLGSTFRGTRTVTHDASGGAVDEFYLDEPVGEREVVVRFETDNPNDLKFILPNTHYPVIMRETRGSRDVRWEVKYLDGVAAGLYTTGRSVNILYGGRRGTAAGRSRFTPPRLEIWLSVLVGSTRGGEIWADIYYDLRAD